MEKRNEDVRKHAEAKGVYLWQVAERMNRSYDWLMRKLRKPMNEAEKKEICHVIDSLSDAN